MEIHEIKSQLRIGAVLSHYGLVPDRNNRLHCPWHDDKTPSLQIYPNTDSWTCFSSACDAGSGDAIDFIMKYQGVSKHEALVKAKQLIGVSSKHQAKTDYSREAVLTKYYQNSLKAITHGKKGKAYCAERNLSYDKLKIGFCGYEVGRTWNEHLQEKAEEIGLFKIKNCIVFAMKNKAGHIVSMYGRSVGKNPKVRHFYLPKGQDALQGGHQGLYPSYPKIETKRLVLTESIIDAASIKQDTEWPVLALYGTNGLTIEHSEAVSELQSLEEIVLFFDGDEAGRSAIHKHHKRLKELRPDITISYVETPEGEDVNSLRVSHEPEILNHLLASRKQLEQKTISPQSKSSGTKHRPQKGKLDTDNPELLRYETELLHLTILGGIKITGLDKLRVTLKVQLKEYSHHLPVRHSLDLYHSKQVELLVDKLAEALEIGSTESERTISEMTGALEQYRQEKLELLKPKQPEVKVLTAAERAEAVQYLKDKKLLRNTLEDIAQSGIVGERTNSLIAYLAYTSRKREKPLHIMCLGASGTGKTYLQEKVSELIPEEEKIEITSLSDNAFYYFGREELKHKLILIEDLDGAENVLYPLRELQSKRRISKTVTLKDNKGNLKTMTLKVEGPVCVSGCTTRERIYEDNANRCILLYIDDSTDQDRRIMGYQQRASAGNIDASAERYTTKKLQNVQRILKPIKVVNPYAELIDLPQEVFKPRRTLVLLLSFIETITYYHQYQRTVKTDAGGATYIESSKEDIEAAFSLMKEVLFSKSDELTKASRKFLERLKGHVSDGEVFYATELRKQLRISSSTLHRYIKELSLNGYLKRKGGSKYRGYEYEIADYKEYDKLKDEIDQQLTEILSRIESIPASQRHPTVENGIIK